MSAQASIEAPAASSAHATLPAPWPYALALTTAMMPVPGVGLAHEEGPNGVEVVPDGVEADGRDRRADHGSAIDPGRPLGKVLESRVLLEKRESHRPGRAVALFADDDFGRAFRVGIALTVDPRTCPRER